LNPPQKRPSGKDAGGRATQGAVAARVGSAGVSHRDIDAERAGQRLDNYLLGELKGVPRSHVYRLIRSGQVRVNSGRTSPSYRLQAGDRVRVPPVGVRPPSEPSATPDRLEWLEERIIYEDAKILVLDKPAGLAVHGGSNVSLGVIEALRLLRPQSKDLELAHRLDRGTSGCLLLAKRRSALRVLHELLREGHVDKRYLALLQGLWPDGTRDIEAPLVTRRVGGEARVKVDEAGKEARSSFRVVDRFGKKASLVEVAIDTGRTHQIRVHAAHAGHPVAGDERYGDKDFNEYLKSFGLKRMFLHAHSLSFDWPDTGEPFNASAPLPDELKSVLTALEARSGAHPADRRPAS
jgi:23S rRNA pseudouridine955/2504/2580 synthase